MRSSGTAIAWNINEYTNPMSTAVPAATYSFSPKNQSKMVLLLLQNPLSDVREDSDSPSGLAARKPDYFTSSDPTQHGHIKATTARRQANNNTEK